MLDKAEIERQIKITQARERVIALHLQGVCSENIAIEVDLTKQQVARIINLWGDQEEPVEELTPEDEMDCDHAWNSMYEYAEDPRSEAIKQFLIEKNIREWKI